MSNDSRLVHDSLVNLAGGWRLPCAGMTNGSNACIRTIGILLLFVVGFVAPARAGGPRPDWELLTDDIFKSPDSTLSIEQYYTGTFSVPAVFADHSAQAGKTPKPKSTNKATRG
jgi:hypothetical protein